MRFVLLHPSRGRAKKAFETYQYWLSKANGVKHTIDHILSIDIDDPDRNLYYELFKGVSTKIVCSENKNVVQATNIAAALSKGDILIYLSDDFKCPDLWDEKLADNFEVLDMNEPALLKVNDCLQPFPVAVLTIPIMNFSLYQKLGYFWHPGYGSMFVDEDLYWTVKKYGWLHFAPELDFPHEHCSIGKAERDETYIRSEANWDQGKMFFSQRKLEGFAL